MSIFKNLSFVLIAMMISGAGYYGWVLSEEGSERTKNVMRYARMIDTSSEHYISKSSHIYNTRGYFVDRETGLRFGDLIGDNLYRQFEKGGNQPIEVSWPYSIDKREQNSKGLLYEVAGLTVMLLSALSLIGLVLWRAKEWSDAS